MHNRMTGIFNVESGKEWYFKLNTHADNDSKANNVKVKKKLICTRINK